MNKVIVLLRCDLCGKPVRSEKVRRLQFIEVPLCDPCFVKVRRRQNGRTPRPQG